MFDPDDDLETFVAWFLAGFVALLCLVDAAFGQNFVGLDAELRAIAERQRIASAEYWSGSRLPGDWSKPCRLTWSDQTGGGGGATTFAMAGGHVVNFRTVLAGHRQTVAADVIPHEVDHAVRYSLIRRPIARLFDEGSSAIWETGEERSKAYNAARELRSVPVEWLDADRYPPTNDETLRFYGAGLVVAEALLERGTPATLIGYQADPRSAADKLPEYYGLTPPELTTTVFRARLAQCGPEGCFVPYPATLPRVAGKPLLEIWIAPNCDPCHQFQYDYRTDETFRGAIQARYHVHWRTSRPIHALEMGIKGIRSTPAFVVPRFAPLLGYRGKSDLLIRLGLAANPTKPYQPDLAINLGEPGDGFRGSGIGETPRPYQRTDDSTPSIASPDMRPAAVPDTSFPPEIPGQMKRPEKIPPQIEGANLGESAGTNAGQTRGKRGETPQVSTPSPNTDVPEIPFGNTIDGGSTGERPGKDRGNHFPDLPPVTPPDLPPVAHPETPTPEPRFPDLSPLSSLLAHLSTLLGFSAVGATGAGAAVMVGGWLLRKLIQRRRDRRDSRSSEPSRPTPAPERGAPPCAAPFPRKLDELRELLTLRQSEGRVAALDALRGMFFDDEHAKAVEHSDASARQALMDLKFRIDQRVDEVAPISTKPFD